jgi:hypothetical protein
MTRTLALAAALASMLSALACNAAANEDTDGHETRPLFWRQLRYAKPRSQKNQRGPFIVKC